MGTLDKTYLFTNIQVTPNSSWPDVVYYQSYTHPYMGWRINVVDNFNQRFLKTSASSADRAVAAALASILIVALAKLF